MVVACLKTQILCVCVCLPPGHVFDLNTLNKAGGYTVYDNEDRNTMIRLSVCSEMKNAGCADGTG